MRLLALAAALILGIAFPYGHSFTFLVRYCVMVMLVFAFVDIKIERKLIQPSHAWVLLSNGILPWMWFGILSLISPLLGLIGFLTAAMPTAAAAPVLTGFLRGNVAFVTVSVLLTTCLIGVEIPLSLPLLVQQETPMSIVDVLVPVLITLLIPLLGAQGISRWLPKVKKLLLRHSVLAFYLFVLNVYIAMSKASWFLTREMPEAQGELLGIGLVVLLICLLNFGLGALIGGSRNRIGGSMALGRKNTMFTVWVCLTFLSPITAMGPMCYIIFQNSINSLQLMLQKK